MKKNMYVSAVFAFTLLLGACGPKSEKKEKEEFKANEAPVEVTPASDPVAEGESLVKASDCKTCHSKTNKLVGPSHTEVAKKYEFTKANVEMLANKIIKGGQGVYGEIPMSPHPDITKSDAEKMAQYVLSLDGEKLH